MKKKLFILTVLLFLFFSWSTTWGQGERDLILKRLATHVPENHKMIYAGKYHIDEVEKFYLFYQPINSNSCSDLKLKISNSQDQSKEKTVFWVVCNQGMSTIAKTTEGTFFFPAAWQRKGDGMKAALNTTIFLQELKFPEEEGKK